jgi:hypothetical protein
MVMPREEVPRVIAAEREKPTAATAGRDAEKK